MSQKKRRFDVRGSRSVRNTFDFVGLERRVMMHVDPNDPNHVDDIPENLVAPAVNAPATPTGSGNDTPVASAPLTAVPALSSRPSAAAKIYLDFTGDTTTTWGSYTPGATPAYDTDGDATTFSDAELSSIREIFNRVSEKYSPFNIDVTTTNPGNLTNGRTLKVVIGGDGAWLGAQAGGVSYVGSFVNSAPNVAFVFPKMLANGYAKYTAEAVAHESGHAFGLQHQSQFDAAGNKLAEYLPANAAGDAPIMGNSYTARRGLWWYGTDSDGGTQDDLSVISSTSNGFGYRADDFGNTIATSTSLTLSGTTTSASGVIEKTSDLDVFAFTTGAGSVTFNASPCATGGMADLKLQIVSAGGAVVASADNDLAESVTTTLTAGTYYVVVGSHGSYGDVGQYTLSGAVSPVAPVPQPPASPSDVTATTVTSTSTRVSWTDNSGNETGFKVFASRDNKTWTLLGAVGANVTAVTHTGLRRNTTYYYKVQAYNDAGASADSNVATTRTALAAATAVKGDINFDGVVDFNDLIILAQNYNTTLPVASTGTPDLAWSHGDLNDDGVVDFNDLVLLSQNYNTGTPLSADTPADDTDWGTITAINGGNTAPANAAVTSATTAATAAAAAKVATASAAAATATAAKKTLTLTTAKRIFSVKPIARPAARVVASVARKV